MGWFDNEQDGQKSNALVPQSEPRRPVSKAALPESESTMGRQIHVDGTIVCEEDLTILGHVDGTIRAQGTLVIAKEADVHAKIDGQRVLIHGKVDGNVHGSERVVLGQTAQLIGNIEAATLEIIEGAYFKGNVEMNPPDGGKKPTKVSGDQEKPDASSTDDIQTLNFNPVTDPTAAEASATQQELAP
jgi:cytoskeletal protein CcmA (bactofilin family)